MIAGTLLVFFLCFWAVNQLGTSSEPKEPEVEEVTIATLDSNKELIEIARSQGWIEASATEMTSIDASQVKDLGSAFQGSHMKTFDELRYFVGLPIIHANAFAHSNALTSVTIPASVGSMEDGALAYLPALKAIKVDEGNPTFNSRDDCNAVLCSWRGDMMVMAGCVNTKMPDGVRYVAPLAFCGCTGLQTVTFPERLKEIGDSAFADCTTLKDVDIPQGVRFIKPGTFAGCEALQSITLSKSVERLQKGAFAGCKSLQKIVCPKKFPPIIEHAFDAYTATVYVPDGMLNKYYVDKVWKDFRDIRELKN